MDQRAVRGVPWVLLAYAAQRGLTLLTLPALARLLTPEDFGVVALAVLAISLMTLFRDFGLGGALVLRSEVDRRAEGTMLTIVTVSSVVLAIVVAGAAPLIADLFRSPPLEGVLRGLAPSVVLLGVAGFHEMLHQRELAFRRRFVAVFAAAVTYGAVSVGLAVLGAGVWSIVAGQVASAGALAGLLVLLAPYRLWFAWDTAAARSALSVGSGFILQGATSFLRQNADFLAVGRVLGATPLGFYSMSYRLGDLPNQALAEPVARVTFPAFARARAANQEINAQFLAVLRLLALVVTPLGVLLSACSEPFTMVVFGEEWRPLIPLLTIVGVWAIVRPLETTFSWLVNSVGQPGPLGRLSVLLLLVLVPSLFAGAELGGLIAVVWVMLVNEVLGLFAVGRLAGKLIGIGVREVFRVLAPVLVAAPVGWAAARGVVAALEGSADALALVGGIAAGLLAYLAALVCVDRTVVQWSTEQVRRILVRRESAEAPA